jgi:hypothetical protein
MLLCAAKRKKCTRHKLPHHPHPHLPLRLLLLLFLLPSLRQKTPLKHRSNQPRLLPSMPPPKWMHLLKQQPPPHPPSPQNLWWPCVATTDLARRKQKLLGGVTVVMPAVMAGPASGALARVVTVWVIGVSAARPVKAVIFVMTEAPAWAMPLSALSVKPWSVPKCRCANWRRRPMAKRSAV